MSLSFSRALRASSALFFFALPLAGLGSLASSTGCGRTDLSDELITTTPDAGPGDAGGDVTIHDGGFDVFMDDVFVDDVFVDDVFVFDSPIDSPTDGNACGDGVCDDGEDCNSCPFDCGLCSSCGDGSCDDGETCSTCPTDCGFCQTCGDGTCNNGETCSSCQIDCGSCETCGDGFCNDGEDCTTCPEDCGVCQTCGDGTCSSSENCNNCPTDCGECAGCGDGVCSPSESCIACPQDCGSCAFCGNDKCEASAGETCNTCPTDCGTCPLAQTCEQILTCSFQCFQGGIGGFELSCLTDCDANACTQAQGFANQATNCILGAFLDGTCGLGGGGTSSALQCAMTACASQISACLSQAPCPGTTSGSGSGG